MLNCFKTEPQSDLTPALQSDLPSESTSMWDMLTHSQQHAISSLAAFGYALTKVRHGNNGVLAILTLNKKFATISFNGLINMNPPVERV